MIDLFQPCAIDHLQMRNRFVRSATTSGRAGDDGVVGEEIVRRYEELAAGDTGLIVKGHLYVDRRGRAHKGMAGISVTADMASIGES
jgi:2,4-dienoyl-CoA reductase-like NADH-dependent reductase (Old Yellow Enzyme family)